MHLSFLLFALHLAPLLTTATSVPPELYSPLVPQKILAAYQKTPDPIQYPQYTYTNGTWELFPADVWTSGFFPATMYALEERKGLCGATKSNGLGIANWANLGRALTSGLMALEVQNTVGHDVGFLSFPFAYELQINPHNQTAKDGINNFAKLLAARYNPLVGCTKSWDKPPYFKVIIDNMMNLEVLFRSADLTHNQTLRNIATSHADTTIVNHIRSDGGTWHVINYNETTGLVDSKQTNQGYSNDSTWTRGQAWGVNGYLDMYDRTNNRTYLETSLKLANYFLSRMPSDGIVPWDFDAPTIPPPRPADSSAATLASYGFLRLATAVPKEKLKWQGAALQTMSKIIELAFNPSWDSLLSNGTVNWPLGNMLTGTVYDPVFMEVDAGDYYFIKVGTELIKQGLGHC
ncbi:glucuronyl hydrolase [Flagelloscypha sp. PMI_526]|nr:glucuronyl hydrolase [Flagelloscypha sp. PMI_526]